MTNEQLVEQIRNGYSVTDNMQLLYQNNLPLIKQIIRPYVVYEPMEDLLQESYFGLLKAVQQYETSENVLFMSYASYWIRQAVVRYIENCGSVVRISSHTKQKIIRYKKTVERLSQEYGRTPTDKEIAEDMCISISALDNIKKYSQGVSSLDEPLSDDTEDTMGSVIKADFSLENEIIDKIYDDYIESELWGIVDDYTTNEQAEVLRKRYLNDKSYREIAKEKKVSHDWCRQIEQAALRKLRMGRARRRLLEIVDANIYHTGKANFDRNFSSQVERMAIRRIELEQQFNCVFKSG